MFLQNVVVADSVTSQRDDEEGNETRVAKDRDTAISMPPLLKTFCVTNKQIQVNLFLF